jgi:hypothetical protein
MPRTNHGKRPKLPPASNEMRRISALLAEEMSAWPDVTTRPMFGLRAAYGGGVIFALLPDKRSLETPNGLGYKKRGKWMKLQITDEASIGAALAILEKAYTTARRSSDNPE